MSKISLSVVLFCLVHFSVQVCTWWWSKSSRFLIGTKGICIGFIDIIALVGNYTVNLFGVYTTLEFPVKILSNFLVGLSSDRKPILVTMVYRDCCQIFFHWRLKILIKLSYLIFLSSVHSRFKFKSLINKKHKAIIFSKWAHQVFPITGIILSILSRRFIQQSVIKSPSVRYTYELHFKITHLLFKRQSQMCSKLRRFS